MKAILNQLLDKLGYILIKKQEINSPAGSKLGAYNMANAREKAGIGMLELLQSQKEQRWLEFGTGGRDDDHFFKIDIIDFPEGQEPRNYRKINIITCTEEELLSLGKFNFIRMQHVFEHFTPEDGLTALINCSKILEHGGYILISCPDIDKVIKSYQEGSIQELNGNWGSERIGAGAPESFYFSIFTHSVQSEPHLWCYNAEGIHYQLERSKQFTNIQVLDLDHKLATILFTHNRPQQDVVVIAQKT
jgi:SAM-dependent methyltransferase